MLTKNIRNILRDAPYWVEGNIVYGNYGDTNTFTYCIARSKFEARNICDGINILSKIDSEELELKELA
jgi:hypothetical protein